MELLLSKYATEIDTAQCTLMYIVERTNFIRQISDLNPIFLKTYIGILKNNEKLLISVEFILNDMLKMETIENPKILELICDILHLSLSIRKNETVEKDVCAQYLDRFDSSEIKEMAIYIQIAGIIVKIYPDEFAFKIVRKIKDWFYFDSSLINVYSLMLAETILKRQPDEALLEQIYNDIMTNRNNYQRSSTLTYLLDLYLTILPAALDRNEFWQYLQQQILSPDKRVRKQIQFILKKCVEHTNGWNNFFTVIEILHDNQSNLILPAIELIPKPGILPSNWNLILLIKLLEHENRLVLHAGVNNVLENIQLDGKNLEDNSIERKLLLSLLNALNNTFLYTKQYDVPVENLSKFFQPILNEILDDILAVNWNSVPLYYLIESIHDSLNIQKDLPFIMNLIRSVHNLTNVGIRKRILRQIGEIFVESPTLDMTNLIEFLQFIDIDWMIKSDLLNKLDITKYNNLEYAKLINNENIFDVHKLTLISRLNWNLDLFKDIFLKLATEKSRFFYLLEKIADITQDWMHFAKQMLNDFSSNIKDFDELVMVFSISELIKRYRFDDVIPVEKLLVNGKSYTLDEIIRKMSPKSISFQRTTINSIFYLYINRKIKNMEDLRKWLIQINISEYSEHLDDIIEFLQDFGRFHPQQTDIEFIEPYFDSIFEEISSNSRSEWVDRFLYLTDKHFSSKYLIQFILLDCSKMHGGLPDLYRHLYNDYRTKGIVSPLFQKCIEKGLDFGSIPQGAQRIETNICLQIYEYQYCSWKERASVRMHTIQIILKLGPDEVINIKNYLFDRLSELHKAKPRYYADSYEHRIKLRLVQALAACFENQREWDDRVLEMLLNENNQINVTFILKCIVASTVDLQKLVEIINNATSNHARQSLCIIAYYVCTNDSNSDYTSKCIDSLIPWTMGAHFNTRLYSQITIKHLIEECGLKEKYSFIYESILSAMKQGNAKQICDKFMKDFRFNYCYFDELLCAPNYLYEIPSLTDMALDERLSKNEITQTFSKVVSFKPNMKALDNNLEYLYCNQQMTVADNVQKKIIPIKEQFLDKNIIDALPHNIKLRKKNNEGLIVVASLISRSPNLGGLSRTCEIFGAEQLVIDSLQHIDNKEFQALSMTSEKWLNIGEVKPHQLIEYLLEMKLKGYYIVGAEQTSNGKLISECSFPKKTILLLGHEKDGIPANLITILDMAVEIPQLGVVRSLNVHVTGALFIWEYCKQHKFAK